MSSSVSSSSSNSDELSSSPLAVDFTPIEEAVRQFREGGYLIVMDNPHRENEGDLIIAGYAADPDKMCFALRYGTGIICAPLPKERQLELNLPYMVDRSTDPNQTAFTHPVDYKTTSTGVSAADRSATIIALATASGDGVAEDFRRPGHVYPLVAKDGGVLQRGGHTESAVDLCRMAGIEPPVGCIVELIDHSTGRMMRLPECAKLAKEFNIPIITVDDLKEYRRKVLPAGKTLEVAKPLPEFANNILYTSPNDSRHTPEIAKKLNEYTKKYVYPTFPPLQVYPVPAHLNKSSLDTSVVNQNANRVVTVAAETVIPLHSRDARDLGLWTLRIYKETKPREHQHTVLIKGNLQAAIDAKQPVYVRAHSECFTGDILGSQKCDCGEQLDQAKVLIADKGTGVIIYIGGHEGRGIGLVEKIKAYEQQRKHNLDTYQANKVLGHPDDKRDYAAAISILRDLGLASIVLLTDNKQKAQAFGDLVVDTLPVICKRNKHNAKYLQAKVEKTSIVAAGSSSVVPVAAKNVSDTKDDHSVVITAKQVPSDLYTPNDASPVDKLRIGIIRTRWNSGIVDTFANAIEQELLQRGILEKNIVRSSVPGAWELPLEADQVIQREQLKQLPLHCVICVGVLFKGETMHFDHISNATVKGLMKTQLARKVPIVEAVLACFTDEQAIKRIKEQPWSLAETAINRAQRTREFKDFSLSPSK